MIAGKRQRLERPRVIEVFVSRGRHNGVRSNGPARPIG
jgi:hypothetical protein